VDVGRGAGKEENPPPKLATTLCQPLQVQHLSNRHTPQRQQMFMEVVPYNPIISQLLTSLSHTKGAPTSTARPRLEARRIARHRAEPAIVQPVEHVVLLLQPRVGAGAAPARGQRRAPGAAERGVRGAEARAHEERVAGAHVAALRGRAQVEGLRGRAGAQVGVGDGVGGWAGALAGSRGEGGGLAEGVVVDAVGLGVAPVVEEDAAGGDAVVGPVVERVLQVRRRADVVAALAAVVEGLCWDVCELWSGSDLGPVVLEDERGGSRPIGCRFAC
jgi:hypothetical protein